MVEIQGIWVEDDEKLKSAIAVWGIAPKGMSKLKKRTQEDDVANVNRSGKPYKLSFFEKDHPSRNLGEGSRPVGINGNEEKEEARV